MSEIKEERNISSLKEYRIPIFLRRVILKSFLKKDGQIIFFPQDSFTDMSGINRSAVDMFCFTTDINRLLQSFPKITQIIFHFRWRKLTFDGDTQAFEKVFEPFSDLFLFKIRPTKTGI